MGLERAPPNKEFNVLCQVRDHRTSVYPWAAIMGTKTVKVQEKVAIVIKRCNQDSTGLWLRTAEFSTAQNKKREKNKI